MSKRSIQNKIYIEACLELEIKRTSELLEEINELPLLNSVRNAKNDSIGFANGVFWFQN